MSKKDDDYFDDFVDTGVEELKGSEDDDYDERREIYRKELFEKRETESDYEYSRRIYYGIIAAGGEAVEEAMRVAQETEHPRAFEVLSKLINDVGNTTEKLLNLQKTKREIENPKNTQRIPGLPPGDDDGKVIMSTNALQKLLQDNAKKIRTEKEVNTIEHDNSDNSGT